MSLLLSTSLRSKKRKRRDSNHLPPDLIHDKLDHRATVPCHSLLIVHYSDEFNFWAFGTQILSVLPILILIPNFLFQSKQLSPARSASTSGHTDHSITTARHTEHSITNARTYFQHHATSTSTANGRMITSAPSTTTMTTSIPLPSNSSTSSNSSIGSTSNGLKYVGKLPVSQVTSQNKLTQPVTFTARRDAEKSASADAHINQLRMVRV